LIKTGKKELSERKKFGSKNLKSAGFGVENETSPSSIAPWLDAGGIKKSSS